jgi:hypothetical protein
MIALLLWLGLHTGDLWQHEWEVEWTPSQAEIVQIPLPSEVFRSLIYPDWRDLTLVNGEGQAILFSLEVMKEKEEPQWQTIPCVRIPDQLKEGQELRVFWTQHNHQIRVDHEVQPMKRLRFLAEIPESLRNKPLQLKAIPTPDAEGLTSFSLLNSDDLTHWTTRESGTLARFQKDRANIEHLDLARHHPLSRFVMIETEGFALTGLKVGEIKKTARFQQWETPVESDSYRDQDLFFSLEGHPPVTGIRVLFKDLNFSTPVTFYSGSRESNGRNSDLPDQRRAQGIAYQVGRPGHTIHAEFWFPPVTDPLWRLRFEDPIETLLPLKPTLSVVSAATQLTFLPRGGPPFRLLAGSRQPQKNLRRSPSEIIPAPMNETLLLAQGRVLERKMADGEAALQPTAGERYRRWLLWSVLVGATAVIAGLAYRLLKTTDLGSGPTP